MATRPLIKECLQMLNVCGADPVSQNKWSKVRVIGSSILLAHLMFDALLQTILSEKGWKQMESIPICVGSFLGLYKISFSVIQQKKFEIILKDMGQFFILDNSETVLEKSIKDSLKSATQVFKFFIVIVLLALFAFLVKPLLTFTQALPFNTFISISSNFHLSFYYYRIMYVVQVIQGVIAYSGMIGFDYLFMAFIIHITCELKILKRKLSTIEVNVDVNADDENCLREIGKLIDHHNFILRCIKNLNKLYATALLVQFSISIPLICVGLFFLAIDGFPPPLAELFQFTPYTISVLMQLFIYCLGGTYLTIESEGVADAIYESDWWIKTQPKFRRVCVLIIQRANKREYLTAGGMFILNLESFTKIVRFALSFFSMTKATYGSSEMEQ